MFSHVKWKWEWDVLYSVFNQKFHYSQCYSMHPFSQWKQAVRALSCLHFICSNVVCKMDMSINNCTENWHMLAWVARLGIFLFLAMWRKMYVHSRNWRDIKSEGLWRCFFISCIRGKLSAMQSTLKQDSMWVLCMFFTVKQSLFKSLFSSCFTLENFPSGS